MVSTILYKNNFKILAKNTILVFSLPENRKRLSFSFLFLALANTFWQSRPAGTWDTLLSYSSFYLNFMKNVIMYLGVFCAFVLSSCDKSRNLKENCYQAKLLNSGQCGQIIQIIAGSPSLKNSIWIDNNGNKKQRSYLVDESLEGYTVGQTVYIQVKSVIKTPEVIMPAICSGRPEYLLEINVVDTNCEVSDNKM